jgi:hypothetical protein
MPQAMYQRFEANGLGRWRRRDGGRCQYPTTVVDVITAIMCYGPEEAHQTVVAWMADDGVELDEQAMRQWLGQKIQWGSIEAGLINRVFLQLVEFIY